MIAALKDQILGTLDPKILYICIGILAICVIIALIKKAIKIVVVCALLAFIFTAVVPMAETYKEKFSIGVNAEEKRLEMVVDGKEFNIGIEDGIKEIELERQSNGEYNVKVVYLETGIATITIPGFMRSPVVAYLDKNNLEYSIVE